MFDNFSQGDTRGRHVNIYYCGNISFGHGWRIAIVNLSSVYDVLAARLSQTNARQRVPVMATLRLCAVSHKAHFVATIHLKFIGFNEIKFLRSENIFVLTEALRYHKQRSTSLIGAGDIIIGKSFDKLVKVRDVKVSTKRWRDGSQTQRYGGSGTGYSRVGEWDVAVHQNWTLLLHQIVICKPWLVSESQSTSASSQRTCPLLWKAWRQIRASVTLPH